MPLTCLVSYANQPYLSRQAFSSYTARRFGGVTRVRHYGPEDIQRDKVFSTRNRHILEQSLGNGLWLWKPYIILQALRDLQPDDYLLYCDVDTIFIRPVDALTSLMDERGLYALVFELPSIEAQYTKHEAFSALACTGQEYAQSRQRLATVQVWKRTEAALAFVRHWLEVCQQGELIYSKETGDENDSPDFIAHKHDQSLFSLLSKKAGLEGFRDPTQWGNSMARNGEYPNSPYPQIFYTGLGDSRKTWWLTRLLGSAYVRTLNKIPD